MRTLAAAFTLLGFLSATALAGDEAAEEEGKEEAAEEDCSKLEGDAKTECEKKKAETEGTEESKEKSGKGGKGKAPGKSCGKAERAKIEFHTGQSFLVRVVFLKMFPNQMYAQEAF